MVDLVYSMSGTQYRSDNDIVIPLQPVATLDVTEQHTSKLLIDLFASFHPNHLINCLNLVDPDPPSSYLMQAGTDKQYSVSKAVVVHWKG